MLVSQEGFMSSGDKKMLALPIQSASICRDQSTRGSSRYARNANLASSRERLHPAWGDISIEIRAGFGIRTPFADGSADCAGHLRPCEHVGSDGLESCHRPRVL